MTDEYLSSKAHFSSLLISDLLILLCSFIFSNPLYLSYFIFFSPYLLKLISFLCPLLITTFLLFLAFLTGIVHENFSTDLAACTSSVLENLRPEKDYQDEGFQGLDDLGMYEVLFGRCLMNCVDEENPLETPEKKSEENLESGLGKKDSSFDKSGGFEAKKMEEKDPGPVSESKDSCPVMEERRLENFLKILDHFERLSTANVEEKKKPGTKIDKAITQGVRYNAATKVSASSIFNSGGKEHPPMVKAHSERIVSNFNHSNGGDEKDHNLKAESFRRWDHNINSFGSFGSLRKEKEWKRTLGCKLFEERHNVDAGEGMDSLWEAYEENSSDKSTKQMTNDEKRINRSKKMSEIDFNELECYGNEDEDEEDEVVNGHFCCLQAFKSAGKMNLGIGRPNLVKISKAIKGFGWLHHRVSKHSKKVHNNGDR